MFKLLAILVFILTLAGGVSYWVFFPKKSPVKTTTLTSNTTPQEVPADIPIEDKIKFLEEEIKKLSGEANPSSPTSSSTPNLTSRINTLENTVNNLQADVVKLKTTNPTTTTSTSTNKSPLYIPLGAGGGSSAFDWTTSDTLEITLDPTDYPGYKNMTLEVSLRTYQGNGKAFARLYNYTDKLAILSSEVSTTSENYTWVTSNTFTLASGKKAYRFQLKTLTGYEASIQNSRIKVSF